MEHGHLVDTYNKAQKLFYMKKYSRAKRLFQRIVSELYASDSDCVADMQLCGSSEEYLQDIDSLGFWEYYGSKIIVISIFLLLSIAIYCLLK